MCQVGLALLPDVRPEKHSTLSYFSSNAWRVKGSTSFERPVCVLYPSTTLDTHTQMRADWPTLLHVAIHSCMHLTRVCLCCVPCRLQTVLEATPLRRPLARPVQRTEGGPARTPLSAGHAQSLATVSNHRLTKASQAAAVHGSMLANDRINQSANPMTCVSFVLCTACLGVPAVNYPGTATVECVLDPNNLQTGASW
jgi:hypothetical protein